MVIKGHGIATEETKFRNRGKVARWAENVAVRGANRDFRIEAKLMKLDYNIISPVSK